MARGRMIIVNGSKHMLATVNKEMKAALAATAKFWHTKFLPGHFEEGAKRKYGYQTRSRNHQRRKRKRYGHNIDLVFSGNMARHVINRVKITSSKKKGTAWLLGPRYLFQFRKDFSQADKAAELVRFTKREWQQMNQFLHDFMTKKFKENKQVQRLRA